MPFEMPAHIDPRRVTEEAVLDEQGRWLRSRINLLPEVAGPSAVTSVIVKDDTIRSGANTPGVHATTEQKLRIAERLEDAGVVEAEGGYANLDENTRFVKALRQRGTKLRLGAHCGLGVSDWKMHIDRAVDAGYDIVNLVGMQGYLMTQALHPRLSGQALLDRMAETVRYSKSQGQFTAIGTVAPTLENLRQSVETVLEAGADRFYLYDTRGWHTPQAMAYLTRFVRDIVGDRMEIAIHCHDDFGLALANTVEAVRAGGDVVDVTLIRTGHRCGNASFEQTVVALEVLHDIRTGIKLEKLYGLCKFVEETYGLRIPPNAPIVGESMFVYGGVHINALLTGAWFLWENLRAEVVGHSRRVEFGPTSLRRGDESPVALKARQMGVRLDDAQLEQVYRRLGAVIEERHAASEVEVESLIREAASGAG